MNVTTKPTSLERVRYYSRQLMTAEDMRAEQDYFLERMRRHNRLLHGWGIVCGLTVERAAEGDPAWRIRITAGFALSPQGDEIHVPREVRFDLANASQGQDDPCTPCPCPPAAVVTEEGAEVTWYLAIRYLERGARPVRVGHGTCGCSDASCETSRTRDDFELRLLPELPVPYGDAAPVDADPLFPACPRSDVGPWIILAQVRGPIEPDFRFDSRVLRYPWRRVIPRVQQLRTS